MTEWLKQQGWYWSLCYEHGLRPKWLPLAEPKTRHVLLLPGMEPPAERPGWKQKIAHIPQETVDTMKRHNALLMQGHWSCRHDSLKDNPQSGLYDPGDPDYGR